MTTTTDLSVTVTADEAALVQRKVDSGEYATPSDVVREGLHALADQDDAVERWLRDTVVPICEDVDAGRGEFMSPDEVLNYLAAERR